MNTTGAHKSEGRDQEKIDAGPAKEITRDDGDSVYDGAQRQDGKNQVMRFFDTTPSPSGARA